MMRALLQSIVAVGFVGAFAEAAQAQTTTGPPVVVGNYYEDSFRFIYQTDVPGVGFSSTVRLSNLPNLPSPYTLTLTEIGCDVSLLGGARLQKLIVSISDEGANIRRPHPVSVPVPPGSASFREPLNFLIVGASIRTPVVRFVTSRESSGNISITLACTVVGTITPS